MKPLSLLLQSCVVILFVLTSGCQKEEVFSPNEKLTFRAPPCTPPAGAPFFTYSANPTLVGVPVTITFDANNGADCGNIQIQQLDPLPDVIWDLVATGTPTAGILTYTFTPTVIGTYQFRGKYTGSGPGCTHCNNPASGGFQDAAVGLEVIAPGCDHSLTATVVCNSDVCNRSVTFTYIAGDDGDVVIQGGLTHFTVICTVAATGGLTQNTTYQSVLNSNSNVTRWEGTVEECEVYTVTITWTSTNGDPAITGEWTVKDGDGNLLASLCPLDCSANCVLE